jgi:lipoyl(octanoyl) transferase
MPKPKVHFEDLGQMGYQQAWDHQETLFESVVARKLRNRDLGGDQTEEVKHHLLFVEHPPVYTLGKSGDDAHLLVSEDLLKAKGATFHRINRGGDITFHGPGQIVGYPILDLDDFFTDIHKYLRFLEEAIIRTLADYGIEAGRLEGATGVWLEPGVLGKERKIAALGVRCSRWVTMHGFAFNINTDLSFYQLIVPCGIADKPVTSMQQELGRKVDLAEVAHKLKRHLADVFAFELIETPGNPQPA